MWMTHELFLLKLEQEARERQKERERRQKEWEREILDLDRQIAVLKSASGLSSSALVRSCIEIGFGKEQNRAGYRGCITDSEDENSDYEASEPEEERSERKGSEQSEGVASGSDTEGEGSDRPVQSEAEVEGLDRQDESDANQKKPVKIDVSDQHKRNDNGPVHQDMSNVERSVHQGIKDAEQEDQQEENETEQTRDEVEEGGDNQSDRHSERSAPSSSPRGSDKEVSEREARAGSENDNKSIWRRKTKQIEEGEASQRGSVGKHNIRRKKKRAEEDEGSNRRSDVNKEVVPRKRTRKKRVEESEGSQQGSRSDREPVPRKKCRIQKRNDASLKGPDKEGTLRATAQDLFGEDLGDISSDEERKEAAAAKGFREGNELDKAEKSDAQIPDLENKDTQQDEPVPEGRMEVEIPRIMMSLGEDLTTRNGMKTKLAKMKFFASRLKESGGGAAFDNSEGLCNVRAS